MLKTVTIQETKEITFVVDQDYFDGNKTYEEALKKTIELQKGQKFTYNEDEVNSSDIEEQL